MDPLERISAYSRRAAVGFTTAASFLALENATHPDREVSTGAEAVTKIIPENDPLRQPMRGSDDLIVPEKTTAQNETFEVPLDTDNSAITDTSERVETNLKQLLHSDQNFGRFLQVWKKKNSRGTNFDRRGYNTFDAGKIRAEFSKDLQLKVYMGLFNNPPETAGVQMKKYYKYFIDSEGYRKRVHDTIIASSAEFDVPVDVIYGVIGVESGGHMHKVSHAGAVGIMQIKHDGAYEEMIRLAGIPEYQELLGNSNRWKKMDIGNVKDNIMVGVAYLRVLFDRYQDWNYALMAYNAGPRGFEKSLVKLYNQKSGERHARERENSLGRGKINIERAPTIVYETVRKDFSTKFLKVHYPTFASVLVDAGTSGINVFYPLKAGVLTEPTKIAVEEGRVQP